MNASCLPPTPSASELGALAAVHEDPSSSLPGGPVGLDALKALHAAGLVVMPDRFEKDQKPWPVSRKGLQALRAAGRIPPAEPIPCIAAIEADGTFIAAGAGTEDWRDVHDAYPLAVPLRRTVPDAPGWTHILSGHDGPGTPDRFWLVRLQEPRLGCRVRFAFREPGPRMTDVEGLTGTLVASPFGEDPSDARPRPPYAWMRPDAVWKCRLPCFVARIDMLEWIP